MIAQTLLPSETDVEFFQKNGYWLAGKVVDDERLDRLREAMDKVYAGEFETGREPWMGGWKPTSDPLQIRKADNVHWSNDTLRALATDPTIGAMAARLLHTPEIRLWHDQLLYKPGQGKDAKRSGNVGWHQDTQYWRCTIPNLITAWIAFDDVTLDNGCMQVVPGSHQWGLMEPGDFFNTDLETLATEIEKKTGKPFRTAPCTLKAGEVSFHHSLTLHGSGPNLTDKPRRSLVAHLMPADACYISGTPNDNHMNAILLLERGGRHGDLFKGDLWPVLYSES